MPVKRLLFLSEILLSMLMIELTIVTRGLPTTLHSITSMARLYRSRRHASEAMLQTIPHSISRVARALPGQHRCLSQALTALFMCRRRCLPVTFHMGARCAAPSPSAPVVFEAHAWIEHHGRDIFGGTPGEFASLPALPRTTS